MNWHRLTVRTVTKVNIGTLLFIDSTFILMNDFYSVYGLIFYKNESDFGDINEEEAEFS